MNKQVRNIGLMALAAGVLYYPAMRLYRAWAGRKMEAANPGEDHISKPFAHLNSEPRAHNRTAAKRHTKKNMA